MIGYASKLRVCVLQTDGSSVEEASFAAEEAQGPFGEAILGVGACGGTHGKTGEGHKD